MKRFAICLVVLLSAQSAWGAVPTVTGVYPAVGYLTAGTGVVISGTNFSGTPTVTFGGVAATAVAVQSSTAISCTSPAGSAGTVDVVVTTSGGTSTTSTADHFTYQTSFMRLYLRGDYNTTDFGWNAFAGNNMSGQATCSVGYLAAYCYNLKPTYTLGGYQFASINSLGASRWTGNWSTGTFANEFGISLPGQASTAAVLFCGSGSGSTGSDILAGIYGHGLRAGDFVHARMLLGSSPPASVGFGFAASNASTISSNGAYATITPSGITFCSGPGAKNDPGPVVSLPADVSALAGKAPLDICIYVRSSTSNGDTTSTNVVELWVRGTPGAGGDTQNWICIGKGPWVTTDSQLYNLYLKATGNSSTETDLVITELAWGNSVAQFDPSNVSPYRAVYHCLNAMQSDSKGIFHVSPVSLSDREWVLCTDASGELNTDSNIRLIESLNASDPTHVTWTEQHPDGGSTPFFVPNVVNGITVTYTGTATVGDPAKISVVTSRHNGNQTVTFTDSVADGGAAHIIGSGGVAYTASYGTSPKLSDLVSYLPGGGKWTITESDPDNANGILTHAWLGIPACFLADVPAATPTTITSTNGTATLQLYQVPWNCHMGKSRDGTTVVAAASRYHMPYSTATTPYVGIGDVLIRAYSNGSWGSTIVKTLTSSSPGGIDGRSVFLPYHVFQKRDGTWVVLTYYSGRVRFINCPSGSDPKIAGNWVGNDDTGIVLDNARNAANFNFDEISVVELPDTTLVYFGRTKATTTGNTYARSMLMGWITPTDTPLTGWHNRVFDGLANNGVSVGYQFIPNQFTAAQSANPIWATERDGIVYLWTQATSRSAIYCWKTAAPLSAANIGTLVDSTVAPFLIPHSSSALAQTVGSQFTYPSACESASNACGVRIGFATGNSYAMWYGREDWFQPYQARTLTGTSLGNGTTTGTLTPADPSNVKSGVPNYTPGGTNGTLTAGGIIGRPGH